jgi:hypothetical protein
LSLVSENAFGGLGLLSKILRLTIYKTIPLKLFAWGIPGFGFDSYQGQRFFLFLFVQTDTRAQ